jgi:hypothetical protein
VSNLEKRNIPFYSSYILLLSNICYDRILKDRVANLTNAIVIVFVEWVGKNKIFGSEDVTSEQAHCC